MKTFTVKPVNKGLLRERQNMVFIDKWPLFGGYFVSFYPGRVIEVGSLFEGYFVLFYQGLGYLECGLYLQDSLYSEVAFYTGLIVVHP